MLIIIIVIIIIIIIMIVIISLFNTPPRPIFEVALRIS